MFVDLFISTLFQVWQYSIILFLIMLLLHIMAISLNNNWLLNVMSKVETWVLGIFGVFRCDCTKKIRYCWMWLRLNSCLAITLAVSIGMILMALLFALIPLMAINGVTNLLTLYTPIVLYLIYPITAFLVRRPRKTIK